MNVADDVDFDALAEDSRRRLRCRHEGRLYRGRDVRHPRRPDRDTCRTSSTPGRRFSRRPRTRPKSPARSRNRREPRFTPFRTESFDFVFALDADCAVVLARFEHVTTPVLNCWYGRRRYTPVACPRSSAARHCRRLGRWLRARVRRVRRCVPLLESSKDIAFCG